MTITELTSEQAHELMRWRDEWFRIGTCSQPVDRDRAEAAIVGIYHAVRHPAPRFLWTPSPAAALDAALRHSLEVEPFTNRVALNKVMSLDQSERAMRDSIGGVIGSVLWDTLQASLRSSLYAAIDNTVGKYLHGALWSPLERSIEGAVWRPLRTWLHHRTEEIAAQVLRSSGVDRAHVVALAQRAAILLAACGRNSVTLTSDVDKPFQLRWAFGGQHDAHWVAFFSFCEHVLGAPYAPNNSQHLKFWIDLCHAGWWAPYKEYCICAERPSAVYMERVPDIMNARLHCTHGAALAFLDGTALHAIHGVVR